MASMLSLLLAVLNTARFSFKSHHQLELENLALRQHYPGIAIHARGHDRQHCDELLEAGATIAISDTLEASLQIGGAVLNTMGVFEEDAAVLIESFRKEYYG